VTEVGPTSVAADGGTVAVQVEGAEPPLVLLHSLLTDGAAFSAVVPQLAQHRRVFRLGLPGFGGSTALPGEPTITDYADRVATAIDALDLGRNTAILGNGFGSFVAAMTAARHGGRLESMIACNTGLAFPADRRGAFTAMALRVTEGGMAAVLDVAVERIFPPGYLDGRPALAARCRAVLAAMDPGAFAAACKALAALDLSGDVAGVTVPTLVIAGELDQTTPAFMATGLAAAIAGSRLVVIPECGHCPQIEQPDALVGTLVPFLAG
jgi:3-oxoadipate enol-lactonase